ncbi:MAG: M48 family metalloprotease, partial [Dehalococcoidia bacterium]
MAQEKVLVYDRIGANRRNTFLLLAVFIVFVGAFLVALGIVLGLPFAFAPFLIVPVIIYALFSYYASMGITLAISQAHEVTKEEEPEYYRTVENLCIGAGLPLPKLYVIEDRAPNAFATGRDPNHAVICVTRGLLQKMDHLELEGVLAHELSHIGNYDIRLMTLVVVLIGIVARLADFMFRFTIWGAGGRAGNRERSGGSAVLIIYAVALIFAIL